MTEQERDGRLKPFFWVEHSGGASVCLEAGCFLQEVFDTRAEGGFEGNGYDWASLAQVFLEQRRPELREKIHMDPEAGMFCAYSKDGQALLDFALSFRGACDDREEIGALFAQAELD